MKIKAINDHVVVEELKEPEKVSRGGVIMPSTVIDQPHRFGIVISVGPDVKDSVKVGEKVAYARHGGQVMAIDERAFYKVLKLAEVYCVLEED
jgi:co-chaperonin GroES (HSP10)